MSTATPALKKLPGVMSLQRLNIVTDALFYNILANGAESPVHVVRHGIRGTQNVNNTKEKDVNNVQVTETAKTDPEATGLLIRFNLAFLPLSRALFGCAGEGSQTMREGLDRFIERAATSEGLQDVALRLARNIFNGRWLWRNRLLGQRILIRVFINDSAACLQQDALNTSLKNFDTPTPSERELASFIKASLVDEQRRDCRIHVEALIEFGFKGAVEVFPSQNYTSSKPKGFSRPLYKHPLSSVQTASSMTERDFLDTQIMGQAAFRDQKISNALRTIDSWFKDYQEVGMPIAVEPKGASLEYQRFFRDKEDSSFKIMCKVHDLDPDSPEGRFLLAALIRGGVYSEGDKGPPEEKGEGRSKKGAEASDDTSVASQGEAV